MVTYQDMVRQKEEDPSGQGIVNFIKTAINKHKTDEIYTEAVIADEYDRKQNRTIIQYQKLLYTIEGHAVPDSYGANFKMGRAFFPFFVTQENQYLLGNGITWENEGTEDRLGTPDRPFDTQMQNLGHMALVGGVAFGFFNLDHLDVFSVTEFVPMYDEETGALRAGIRFWQIDETKPLRATLYEEDGYTDYIWRNNDAKGSEGEILNPKRAYMQIVKASDADGMEIVDSGNYPGFPVIPMYGNRQKQSELTGLREQIDCYDLIKSGFANTVDEASYMYWAIQNAGGMDDIDLKKFVDRMRTVHAAVVEDSGAKAEAHTMETPYNAREALLQRIERDLFKDAMALDIENIAAGANTATQIRAAYEPLNAKTDGYEYCVNTFIRAVLKLIGIDDNPTFTRSTIVNVQEEIQTVLSAGTYLTADYVTRKILTILGDGDLADEMIEQTDADELIRGGVMESESAPGEEAGEREQNAPEPG